MLEVVLAVLRTPKGRCLVDPDLGVDWSRVQNLTANAGSVAKAVIESALQRYVSAGLIANLQVATQADPEYGRLVYGLEFRDVRAQQRVTIQGEVSA